MIAPATTIVMSSGSETRPRLASGPPAGAGHPGITGTSDIYRSASRPCKIGHHRVNVHASSFLRACEGVIDGGTSAGRGTRALLQHHPADQLQRPDHP